MRGFIVALLIAAGIASALVGLRDNETPKEERTALQSAEPIIRQAVRATPELSDGPPSSHPLGGLLRGDGGPAVHPVSLPALFAKQFDGRDFTVGRVLADNEAYTRYYIMYRSGELAISGVMNVPRGKGPFPVLILNHGYIDPDVYTNGRGLKREQDYLARRGYVVIHPDYRNYADSGKDPDNDLKFRLGYVEDVINAILAVQQAKLPYIDPERIGMLGHSMGGGVTISMLEVRPDLVDAVVLFAPVSADVRDNFDKWITRRPELAEKIIQAYGRPEENPEFWDNVSPLTFLDRIRVPVQLHHGTADDSVPLAWSDRLARELSRRDKDVTSHTYPGEPHEFAASWGTVMERTVLFFDEHVKSGE